jgi:hypothetical protein
MIQVCYYKGCGVVYGEKEPLSDKRVTHGLCPKHLEVSLNKLKAEVEKLQNRKRSKVISIKGDEIPVFYKRKKERKT